MYSHRRMNPHPTRSKPCKIGRKHTGAPSEKLKQKRRNTSKRHAALQKVKGRKFNEQVKAYFAGELDEFPVNPLRPVKSKPPRPLSISDNA